MRGRMTTVRASGSKSASGKLSSSVAAISSSTRVARTGDVVVSRSRLAIATTCDVVFPCE
jgi:hypothetical protein